MAAYAAVVSLMNTMEQIQKHPRLSTSLDKTQLESLQEKAGFLQDFLERDNSRGGLSGEEVEGLERQIATAAHEAEDVIEFHVVEQILGGESSDSLLEVIEIVDSIKEKVGEVKENWGFKEEQFTFSTTATLSEPVKEGFDDDVLTGFLELLTGQSSSRRVIPVVGMGGIGKTMLARNAYENSLTVEYFDIRAWATISQEYNVCEIVSELLSCLGKSTDGTICELGEKLHKKLCGRRYLIVLDDVWSVEVWDKIKFYFPDDDNGSRIVMTTRLLNVSVYFGSSSFEMKFLDKTKSWNLLREKAFGQDDCPPELVKIGKKIAKRCKGLPLSIVVIGGLLRKSNKTKEYWEEVAGNISSILSSGEDELCMNVLSLSYCQLPPRLKPCFLYMGVFEEDEEIRASQLIKLWVGEGFLKPNDAQSLEEVAECYLMDLIERNLILVRKLGLNRKVKTCGIHDLLRELCLRLAKKEVFFQDMRTPHIPQGKAEECRRIVVQGNLHHPALESASLARSLICEGGALPSTFPLLRVLTNVGEGSLEDIFKHVNLRHIKFSWISNCIVLPSSISLMWNLQTLILGRVSGRVDAPSEIWQMQQLRHLECIGAIYLPDPPPCDIEDDVVLQHLQTLVNVYDFRLSDDVCRRIPNVKKLHLGYHQFSNDYSLNNLGRLQKLQSLYLLIYKEPKRDDLVQNLAFPSSLRKLSLRGCCLHWEDLTSFGFLLPRLEVLKLKFDSVVGPKWDPVEGAFPLLKFLEIRCRDLIYWSADNSHFPLLEELSLCRLGNLHEIPFDIVAIPTLQCIRLKYCSNSAAISSTKILEEQLSLGNDDFHVRVLFWDDTHKQRFLEKVDIKSFALKNFVYEALSCLRCRIKTNYRVHKAAIRFLSTKPVEAQGKTELHTDVKNIMFLMLHFLIVLQEMKSFT